MKERNPMPIRKFTLIGLIALGLIILSLVGEDDLPELRK